MTEGCYEFHLAAGTALPSDVSSFGKLRGQSFAARVGLPVQTDGVLLVEPSAWRRCSLTDAPVVFCRPDAPLGVVLNLPRGRDLGSEHVPEFLEQLKLLDRRVALICSLHPSIDFAGSLVPRYRLRGAAMVLVEHGIGCMVEYVGPGFDAGDITRGRCVHTSLTLPWGCLVEQPIEQPYLSRALGLEWQVSESAYLDQRDRRLEDLEELCPGAADEARVEVPEVATALTGHLYRILFDSCIFPLMLRPDVGSQLGCLVNVYGNRPHAVELLLPERLVPLRLSR